MSLFDNEAHVNAKPPFLRLKKGPLGLRAKLLLTILPSVMLVLMTTGFFTYRMENDFIGIALQRNVRVQNRALAHAVESALDRSRQDLLLFAQYPPSREGMRQLLASLQTVTGQEYCELAYISQVDSGHIY
ncbi:MAG: hypothetical protein AB7E51_19065, partial [Pseudodesulfovibrio sp.]